MCLVYTVQSLILCICIIHILKIIIISIPGPPPPTDTEIRLVAAAVRCRNSIVYDDVVMSEAHSKRTCGKWKGRPPLCRMKTSPLQTYYFRRQKRSEMTFSPNDVFLFLVLRICTDCSTTSSTYTMVYLYKNNNKATHLFPIPISINSVFSRCYYNNLFLQNSLLLRRKLKAIIISRV